VPAVIAVLAAALLTSLAAGASSAPVLRSASSTSHRHVLVRFTLGEFVPGRIVVAVKRAILPGGRFVPANIRLDEPLRAAKTLTGYRARTRHALPRGTYYVEISGIVIGTDCAPGKPCPSRWSNVRRVRIRRS
jgi:hypothetical protein